MPRTTRREFLEQASWATASGVLGTRAGRAQQTPLRRPNILLLFPDQHRWDWTPAHRTVPVVMPNLAALAGHGVTFERAHCAAPVCAPSRSCLASGREYDHCGVSSNDQNYPIGQPTFYERLRDAGYQTFGCGKIDLATGDLTQGRSLGLDGRRYAREWGFSDTLCNAGKSAGQQIYFSDPVGPKDSYYAYLDALQPSQAAVCAEDFRRRSKPKEMQWGDTSPSPLAEEHYLDNWIARNGLQLIDGAERDRPWFLVVNFAGPHSPLDIPQRLESRYRGPERTIDGFTQPYDYQGPFDAARHLRIRQNYAAIIENIDHWVGVYVERLRQRGELENTIIVYSSDHGEMLGDHSHWGKSVPWEASVGVPLVVAGRGFGNHRRSDALVSLIDLTATFLDFGEAKPLEGMEGVSLRRLLEGDAATHREYMLSGLGEWRMVFDGRFKLITGFRGVERRLYDVEADPHETHDLAAKQPERVRGLADLMARGSWRPT